MDMICVPPISIPGFAYILEAPMQPVRPWTGIESERAIHDPEEMP